MGLFDFVANAGEKLTEKVLGSTTSEDINSTVQVSPERLNQLRGENIAKSISQLDIDGEQVSVSVDGGVVVLSGTAPSQEALEKMVLCAGNQHGIAQVDCQLQVVGQSSDPGGSTAQPAGDSEFYTVESGDTLGKIAKEHYGDASKYMAIFEANKPMLSDPDKIYPGQKLRIPRV